MIKNIIKPDSISLSTHHLHMGFNDTILSSCTGFIYEKDDESYLITNWHNVSGKNPITGKCLSENGGVPNMVSTMFRDVENPGICHRENIKLYSDENMEKKNWIEHEKFNEKIDVVAIPLPNNIICKYKLFPINKIDFDVQIKTEVSDEVFVIGYPFSDPTYLQMPIWKKASVASEPDINLNQLPMLYIDTATRSGLSGSPVIMQRTGIHGVENGMMSDDSIIGRVRNFIGIYSGRIGEDELKAQLGIVWKSSVIDEIINSIKK